MNDPLLELLGPWLKQRHAPPAEAMQVVEDQPLIRAADRLNLTPAQAAARCLEAGIWPLRYAPNQGTFSAADQARLATASVAIIGAGGLGGMVILQLARLGVGRLKVCDGDVFETSNLNRQFLATMERLGQNKARAAVDEAARVNPLVTVEALPMWADAGNLGQILSGAQVAVDCLDNLPTRYQLEEAAARLGLSYVHGAIAGLEGFVMTVRPGDPGLAGLYGPAPAAKQDSAEAILGVPTMTPAAVATLQVNEVVKLILGWDTLASGEVLHLDLGLPEIESLFLA